MIVSENQSHAGEQHTVRFNPLYIYQLEIYDDIIPVAVEYVDFTDRLCTGTIEMHRSLERTIRNLFRVGLEINFPFNLVAPASEFDWEDEQLMAQNVTSGFNYRLIAGTQRPSSHSFGTAIDINPVQNPYIRYSQNATITKPEGAIYEFEKPGTLFSDHPLVRLLKQDGWIWGGGWTRGSGRIDYQHFEKQQANP